MLNVFKDLFSNLAEYLLGKLPDPSNKYNLKSIFFFTQIFLPLRCFTSKVFQKKVFKIMKNIEISKATGIGTLPRRLLKVLKIYLS